MKLINYLASHAVYFDGTQFFEQELIDLHQFGNLTWTAADQWTVRQFRDLLKRQDEWREIVKS